LRRIYLALLCLTIIGLLFLPNQVYASTHPLDGMGGSIANATGNREVSIPVKVVFVGIDPATVDLAYSKWNINIPTTIYGQVLSPQPHLTGVVYRVDYSYTFASDAFKSRLVSYLQSIQVSKQAVNPWFYYYQQDPTTGYVSQAYHSMNYVVYDANQVENWIYNNQQDLGGFPANGWTIMWLNLTELPSYDFDNYSAFLRTARYGTPNGTAHYYSVSYTDMDLGYTLRYRDFMSGWGGVHRFWFDDLSAGPCFTSYPEELPIQIALRDNNYDIHSSYGKLWFSEYLADYTSQAMLNLVTPALLYDPFYSQEYSFDIHIFDNRTAAEESAVDIRSTVNSNVVRQAFENLVPYSKIDVSVTFEDLAKYPALKTMLHSSYHYANSFTFGVEFAQPQEYGIVDGRPVYKYFQDNLNLFEPSYRRDSTKYTIPVYLFAFSNETTMAFTDKWLIAPIGGVALGDVAFVSFSQSEFARGNMITPPQTDKGLGFTHDVIHEAGHMLGLPHPFDFGPVGNFILTPMSYFTYDYSFGQADKDALHRAHVDSIYLQVQSTMNQLAQRGVDVSQIFNRLRDTDAKYGQMDYVGALASVLQAQSTANNMMASLSRGVSPVLLGAGTTYLVLAASLGIFVGVVLAWLLMRRRAVRPSRKVVRRTHTPRRRHQPSRRTAR
jgi:hypothetical protein